MLDKNLVILIGKLIVVYHVHINFMLKVMLDLIQLIQMMMELLINLIGTRILILISPMKYILLHLHLDILIDIGHGMIFIVLEEMHMVVILIGAKEGENIKEHFLILM